MEGGRGWEQLSVVSGEAGCLLAGDCGAVVCSPSVRWEWYLSPWRPFIGSVCRVCLQFGHHRSAVLMWEVLQYTCCFLLVDE